MAFLNYIYEETHPFLPATPRATAATKNPSHLAAGRRTIVAPPAAEKSKQSKAAPKMASPMRNAAVTGSRSGEPALAFENFNVPKSAAPEEEEEDEDLNSSRGSQDSRVRRPSFFLRTV